ncbi:MAG: hypothetical protein WDZ63_13620 [Burkholderiales bacterium]
MQLRFIADLTIEEIVDAKYDVAFFASGYERRAIHLSKMLDKRQVSMPIVLGFDEFSQQIDRKDNDRFLREKWGCRPIETSNRDDAEIYRVLREYRSAQTPLRFLIDYSSMTRFWYAAILNWVRFGGCAEDVRLDFVYSSGRYADPVPTVEIKDILCIPGCEGGTSSSGVSVAVFGLGFDSFASLCVLDKLEPDWVYGFLADPALVPSYPERCREANRDLLIRFDSAPLSLALRSVSSAFGKLAELVSPYKGVADVTLIPMGPKPHVLASILLAIRFPELACLHVAGNRQTVWPVEATGEIIGTSVHFSRDKREIGKRRTVA